MNVEDIRTVSERWARLYDRGQWIAETLFPRRLRRRLLSRVQCQARCQVLEVGLGTGINLPYAPSCVIYGVDLSRSMLERAVARAHRLDRQLNVETMNAEALAFPDYTFHTVVSTLTLPGSSVRVRPGEKGKLRNALSRKGLRLPCGWDSLPSKQWVGFESLRARQSGIINVPSIPQEQDSAPGPRTHPCSAPGY